MYALFFSARRSSMALSFLSNQSWWLPVFKSSTAFADPVTASPNWFRFSVGMTDGSLIAASSSSSLDWKLSRYWGCWSLKTLNNFLGSFGRFRCREGMMRFSVERISLWSVQHSAPRTGHDYEDTLYVTFSDDHVVDQVPFFRSLVHSNTLP